MKHTLAFVGILGVAYAIQLEKTEAVTALEIDKTASESSLMSDPFIVLDLCTTEEPIVNLEVSDSSDYSIDPIAAPIMTPGDNSMAMFDPTLIMDQLSTFDPISSLLGIPPIDIEPSIAPV